MIDIALDQHRGPHHFAAMELLFAARNDLQLAPDVPPATVALMMQANLALR